jgi:hypothetical protein
VTQASDSAGGFTETTSDTTFYGFIAELSGSERLKNHQLGNDATAELQTADTLAVNDRVVDGTIIYEIVWAFQQLFDPHPKRYLLKREK